MKFLDRLQDILRLHALPITSSEVVRYARGHIARRRGDDQTRLKLPVADKQPHQEDGSMGAETSESVTRLGITGWELNFGQQMNILPKYLPHM